MLFISLLLCLSYAMNPEPDEWTNQFLSEHFLSLGEESNSSFSASPVANVQTHSSSLIAHAPAASASSSEAFNELPSQEELTPFADPSEEKALREKPLAIVNENASQLSLNAPKSQLQGPQLQTSQLQGYQLQGPQLQGPQLQTSQLQERFAFTLPILLENLRSRIASAAGTNVNNGLGVDAFSQGRENFVRDKESEPQAKRIRLQGEVGSSCSSVSQLPQAPVLSSVDEEMEHLFGSLTESSSGSGSSSGGVLVQGAPLNQAQPSLLPPQQPQALVPVPPFHGGPVPVMPANASNMYVNANNIYGPVNPAPLAAAGFSDFFLPSLSNIALSLTNLPANVSSSPALHIEQPKINRHCNRRWASRSVEYWQTLHSKALTPELCEKLDSTAEKNFQKEIYAIPDENAQSILLAIYSCDRALEYLVSPERYEQLNCKTQTSDLICLASSTNEEEEKALYNNLMATDKMIIDKYASYRKRLMRLKNNEIKLVCGYYSKTVKKFTVLSNADRCIRLKNYLTNFRKRFKPKKSTPAKALESKDTPRS